MNGLYQLYGYVFVVSLLPLLAFWLTVRSLKWPQEGDWILRLQTPMVLTAVLMASYALTDEFMNHSFRELSEVGWGVDEARNVVFFIVANITAVLGLVAQVFRKQRRNRSILS